MDTHTTRFPPQPDHEHEWAALEGMLASAVNGREAEYVSMPMTTGPRFMEWYHAEGSKLDQGSDAYKRAHQDRVIAQNRLHARQFVEQLRTQRRIVVEPTSLNVGHWTQSDYRHLWGKVIERYAHRVWLLDGWQYSSGCAFEFFVAAREGIETLSESGSYISRRQGVQMIQAAIEEIESIGQSTEFLRAAVDALREIRQLEVEALPKDETLDRLADSHNVAQFVSFAAGHEPRQRYCRIMGVPVGHPFASLDEAIGQLLNASLDHAVNLRSFEPGDEGGRPFQYGLKTVDEAAGLVRHLASQGLHTIVNETIDIHDGGVSGVLADDLVEFAPDDTPRCVEQPGTAKLPVDIAGKLLTMVYGFCPQWDREPTRRVEFSIHPQQRGVRHEHTMIWEIGPLDDNWSQPHAPGHLQVGRWPHRFSRMLGDKTFGLLVAHALGFSVPHTCVFNSRIAPFTFGQQTGARGTWLRTAPAVNKPGHYPTRYFRQQQPPSAATLPSLADWLQDVEESLPLLSWTAYTLLYQQGFSPDTRGDRRPDAAATLSTEILPSILAQQSVASEWSGSLITQPSGPRVAGVRGFGDRFMVSAQAAQELPRAVRDAVLDVQQQLWQLLGPVSLEWAVDGERVWVLQLHQEPSLSAEHVIVPGNAEHWQQYDTSSGLERLHELAAAAAQEGHGIEFTRGVAATSHAAAIVRQHGVPTRVVASDHKRNHDHQCQ